MLCCQGLTQEYRIRRNVSVIQITCNFSTIFYYVCEGKESDRGLGQVGQISLLSGLSNVGIQTFCGTKSVHGLVYSCILCYIRALKDKLINILF